MEPFEDWIEEQDVTYKIIAKVNGVNTYMGIFKSLDSLQESLHKPERAVDTELLEQFYDSQNTPEEDRELMFEHIVDFNIEDKEI